MHPSKIIVTSIALLGIIYIGLLIATLARNYEPKLRKCDGISNVMIGFNESQGKFIGQFIGSVGNKSLPVTVKADSKARLYRSIEHYCLGSK